MPHTLSLLPITHYAMPKTAFPEEWWAHTYPFDISAASIARVSTMLVTVDSTHGILKCICSLFNVLILAIVLNTHHGIFWFIWNRTIQWVFCITLTVIVILMNFVQTCTYQTRRNLLRMPKQHCLGSFSWIPCVWYTGWPFRWKVLGAKFLVFPLVIMMFPSHLL
jgi:hypothetical protein